jgi:DNA-binding NarL/FixJ family response regulator
MTTRVLLADDERLVRAGFRMIVRAEPDLDVVGEAADGIEAVELARALHPDVVLMDVRMPRLDGINATRQLLTLDPTPAVVVMTTFDLDEYVYQALRAGASGFLLKDAPEEHLLAALRATPSGVAMLAPQITRRLIDAFTPKPPPKQLHPELDRLTTREIDVL